MFSSKKPLFSRPVLAVIMVLSTLVIWVLNLTAPATPFPTPAVTTWKTNSGIPVIWLAQDSWKGSNKLELRFAFKRNSQTPSLTSATLSLLMGDSLPLSTSTINQRLAPLAAKVSSYYDQESQNIGFTINSEPTYLAPTLDIINQWLPSPEFKARAFERWHRQENKSQSIQQELEQKLFPHQITTKTQTITLAAISNNYKQLTHQTTAIFVIGNMTKQTQKAIKASLNHLSQKLALATNDTDSIINTKSTSTSQHGQGATLIETQSAIAITPLSSVKQWLSLQVWGTDMVNTFNSQNDVNEAQLYLTLSAEHPWARWIIHYTNKTPRKKTPANVRMTARSFIDNTQIPSIHDKKRFTLLLKSVKNQLAQSTLNPSWWSNLATTTTQENSTLTLAQFAKTYQNAIDTFNQDDYKAALNSLFITSSYQEIQVNK